MRKQIFIAFWLSLVVLGTSAEQCIKVRAVGDNSVCMKFSTAQKQRAAQYGLQLGTTYAEVNSHMLRSGWKIDPDWLEDFSDDVKHGLPVCGHGWDAVCHIEMKKGSTKVLLEFSGANSGLPLIAAQETR